MRERGNISFYLYKDGEWVVWDWDDKKYITENLIISTLEMEFAS